MSCDNMPYRYEEDQKYPIDLQSDELPYDSRCEPTLAVGDMVRWNKNIRDRHEIDAANGLVVGPWRLNKKHAIVKEAFWALIDWQYSAEHGEYYSTSPRDADADVWDVPYYVPEYVLYWNDGDTSHTSQTCLELVAEASDDDR
jgi:hypothetical protein